MKRIPYNKGITGNPIRKVRFFAFAENLLKKGIIKQ